MALFLAAISLSIKNNTAFTNLQLIYIQQQDIPPIGSHSKLNIAEFNIIYTILERMACIAENHTAHFSSVDATSISQ